MALTRRALLAGTASALATGFTVPAGASARHAAAAALRVSTGPAGRVAGVVTRGAIAAPALLTVEHDCPDNQDDHRDDNNQ
jgi:hypothetical protein